MKENLKIAIQAALAAGKEILKIYSTDFKTVLKTDESPLTLADQKGDAVINKLLHATGIPIISEEQKQTPFETRKNWESCWLVDPLDGTKEFINRNGEFTVNIALIVNQAPILGVIYVPVSKTLYFTAAIGNAAYKFILPNEDISVDEIYERATLLVPAAKTQKPLKVVSSRSHRNEETETFLSKLKKEGEVELLSKGSSLKFCLVAEGLAHLYPRFGPTMEWDTAAGHALCRACGVEVLDLTTQKPLLYNKENLLNNHFLVG